LNNTKYKDHSWHAANYTWFLDIKVGTVYPTILFNHNQCDAALEPKAEANMSS